MSKDMKASSVARRTSASGMKLYTVECGPNGERVAFAFSSNHCEQFARNITNETVSGWPLGVVANGGIDALCAWFAIDAESPDAEVLWIVSRDEFEKAVAEQQKKTFIQVSCEEYRRGGIDKKG